MIQIVYRSNSLIDDGSSGFFVEIARILETSLTNNAAMHITGAMTAGNGQFVQILEGPADSVDRLLARIEGDPRHSGVEILSRREVAARSFGSWSMAYVGRGDAARLMQILADDSPSDATYHSAVAALADGIC